MTTSMWDLFRSRFPEDCTMTAVEAPRGRSFTYGELDELSGRLGTFLLESGVIQGDRVVLAGDKSVEMLALYLACLRIGAVVVPLNPTLPQPELEYFLGDAKPRVVMCSPSTQEAIRSTVGRTVRVEVLDPEKPTLFDEVQGKALATSARLKKADLAAFLYTSGTTGRSKAAMLTQQNLMANALALSECWGFDSAAPDVLLHALPLFHVHGLFVACHCALLNASKMIFLPKFSLQTVLDVMDRCTVMMGVPTYYTRLLAAERFAPHHWANMRVFISGSAPMTVETHRRFYARTGHQVLERYGMTETLITTSNPLDGDRLPGSVGLPLPGVEVRIVNSSGQIVKSFEEVGELEVRGAQVFAGYYGRAEATQAAMRSDGFFATGDLARRDERGYIWLAGRATELIISGGENVYPPEVEGVLDMFETVVESAVFGLPDLDLGESVAAAVVWQESAPPFNEHELRQKLKAHLAPHKVPKMIYVLDELPRNAMGKVQKAVLRRTFAN